MDFITGMTPAVLLLLDAALKGAVLVGAAALAAYLLRHRSAAARHAIWTAAMAGHLALPVLALVAPEWRIPLVAAPAWMAAAAEQPLETAAAADATSGAPVANAPPSAGEQPIAAADPAATMPVAATGSTPASPPRGALFYLVLAWAVGAAFILLRLAVGTWRVSRLARDGARVDDGEWLSLTQRVATRLGIERPLTLLRGDRLGIPVTWGVVYPAVLLPPESAEWPEARRRFVLVHEMAHVKRFDALTQLCSQIALALFWFDPLLWLAVNRMRVEREHACDDYVLRDGTAPSLYAGELLDMVRTLGTPRHETMAPAFAALAMARPAEFEGRMLAILNPTIDRNPLHRIGTFMTAAFVALLALPLAAIHPFDARIAKAELPAPAPAVVTTEAPAASDVANVSGAADGCDAADMRLRPGTTSNSIHADDEEKILTYRSITAGRCVHASLIGDVTFADDERSIVRLGAGAHAFFRERTVGSDRSVEVRRGSGGEPIYEARLDGREVPFDGAMRAWLGGFLPEVLREGAINVPARVARLRARGGTPAVLSEIERIRSSGAKRAHYQELVKTPSLPARDVSAAVRSAGREITSSGDLRSVLQSVPRQSREGADLRGGLAEAIREISSSGDKTAVLTSYGETDDPAMLLMVLTEARGIESSGDKARLLAKLAPRAVGHSSREVSSAFFATAATIESSGDLARTLSVAMSSGRSSEDVSHAIIRASREIPSAGDKSRVLQELALKGLVNTPRLRTEFVAAARTISSDGDFRRTMDALLSREGN